MSIFLWSVYPYLCLTLLVVGSLWRYSSDQIGWTAKSSEIFEKRLLRIGSPLFHYGIIFVFLGHVAGLLVPLGAYRVLGVPAETYHRVALLMGGLSGLAALAGLLLLLYRRLTVVRVRRHSSAGDVVALGLLLLTVALGLAMTLSQGLQRIPYEYRASVGPWIRSVLFLHPAVGLMQGVPLLLQLHVLAAFAVFAATPFTRLVHIFSVPLAYPRRAPLQYRRRGAPADRRRA